MAAKIPLSRGLFAFIDDEDVERITAFKWYAVRGGRTFYAYRASEAGRPIAMHREILCPTGGKLPDHRDGDGLNNTRSNLRVCSHAENIRNQRKRLNTTSRFKGVTFNRSACCWRAEIEQNRERLYLGSFKSELAAAKQYDRAARVLFGQFAKTNADLGLFESAVDDVQPQRIRTSRILPPPSWRKEMTRLGISPRLASRL